VSRTKDKFAFLLQQTEIFAHFLSGDASKDDGKRCECSRRDGAPERAGRPGGFGGDARGPRAARTAAARRRGRRGGPWRARWHSR
jgi:hypothetical protein